MINHKFVFGLASVGIILFAAGATYFILAMTIGGISLSTIRKATTATCDSGAIPGQLTVVFTDDMTSQMQERIIMANGGVVEKTDYNNLTKQYSDTVKVEPGKEYETLRALSQTPGVASAAQSAVSCLND